MFMDNSFDESFSTIYDDDDDDDDEVS